ncbi:MAG: sulfotransferase [Thiohalocapsa sp.]|nr:sulfotransferase [Thiohalocapsa sp.]MCF7991339.1 sulfotransferase [Thiohalocapsa sp.]
MDEAQSTAPVAAGGVGGSGTRLIAELLLRLGYYIGGDLNESSDNLWFTLLFKRRDILSADERELGRCIELFERRMRGRAVFDNDELALVRALAANERPTHSVAWLQERVDSFTEFDPDNRGGRAWGWKEPNTHIVIDRLLPALPAMKYVHLIRNGLDMAYSDNQKQARFWGPFFVGAAEMPITPRYSLKYWCRAHRRLLDLQRAWPDRILLLDYDALCREPGPHLAALLSFLGVVPEPRRIRALADLVRPPPSIGRYRAGGLDAFDPQDVEFVAEMGFAVHA